MSPTLGLTLLRVSGDVMIAPCPGSALSIIGMTDSPTTVRMSPVSERTVSSIETPS